MTIYRLYRDVPLDLCYPSGWRQRGYRVKPGSHPIAHLRTDTRGRDELVPLYGLSQCYEIRGEKAERRRNAYISALYGHSRMK